MTFREPPHGEELTDSELDAMLAKADKELLDHVRARTHPDRALLAMLDASPLARALEAPLTAAGPATRPAPGGGGHAVTVIAMRAQTRDIDRRLGLILTRVEELGEFRAAAAAFHSALADVRTSADAKKQIFGSARVRSLARLALLVVLFDGAAGYIGIGSLSGHVLVGLIGALCSAIGLGALELVVAMNWEKWSRTGLSLLLGLATYVAGIVALRRMAFAAVTASVTIAGTVAFSGSAAALAAASSFSLHRLWARGRWRDDRYPYRELILHEVLARIGIGKERLRFAKLVHRLEGPISRITASAERFGSRYEFRRELQEVRTLVGMLQSKASRQLDATGEIWSLSCNLAMAVGELYDRLSALDRGLVVVRSLIGQVKIGPLYRDQPRWLFKSSRCQRNESTGHVTELARQGHDVAEIAERAISELHHALRLNPVDQLATVHVDASGADLAGADVTDLTLLRGVIWTEETTWPPGTAGRIRKHSENLGSGVYMVGWDQRHPADLIGVSPGS